MVLFYVELILGFVLIFLRLTKLTPLSVTGQEQFDYRTAREARTRYKRVDALERSRHKFLPAVTAVVRRVDDSYSEWDVRRLISNTTREAAEEYEERRVPLWTTVRVMLDRIGDTALFGLACALSYLVVAWWILDEIYRLATDGEGDIERIINAITGSF